MLSLEIMPTCGNPTSISINWKKTREILYTNYNCFSSTRNESNAPSYDQDKMWKKEDKVMNLDQENLKISTQNEQKQSGNLMNHTGDLLTYVPFGEEDHINIL